MSAREHDSENGPSRNLTNHSARYGIAQAVDPLNVTRTGSDRQLRYSPSETYGQSPRPRDAYLHRIPEASEMRRGRRLYESRFLAGVVCATTGLGLLAEGIAVAAAPQHPAMAEALFFVAMVVPFAIFLTVLMIPRLGSLREITVAVLGLYPAVVDRMTSPLVLGGYDEHLHQGLLLNLLQGSGLFAPSPILQVGPYYPGLELFTGVGIRLTGMPVMLAMNLVVLLCRLLLVLIIYHSALLVSPSRRGASLVVAFYAVSSQFYSFNSQFAYQTLALTLGLGGLYLLRRAQLADYSSGRRLLFVASLLLIGTVVTHHATSWMVLAFLIAWAAMSRKDERKTLVRAAVVMGATEAIWTGALAGRLAAYLGPIFLSVLRTAQAYLGNTNQRQVFGTYAGTPPAPEWERLVLIVYIVTCTVAALVCAWVILSRAFHNRDRMLGLLGALNLAFPITFAAHFNPSVGAFGDRASTFLFLPLALSCSLIIQRHPRVIRRQAHSRKPFRPAVVKALIGATSVVFLGGILLGSSPDYQRLPGSYLVSAENRSQDPETLAAVEWAAAHLQAGSTVVADRVPADLLAGQARMWPLSQPQNGFAPSQLYFSASWGPQQTAIVKGLHIDYLYVDVRLADSLPYIGYYIYNGETTTPKRITVADVAKFAHVPGLKTVYHHGPVTIYDTSGLGVTPIRYGYQSYRPMGLGWPLDVILGVVVVLLILLIRRKLAWIKSMAQDSGVLGTTLGVIAITIFIGALLFGFRLMPGPGFTVGAVATSAVIVAVHRRRNGLRLVARLPAPRAFEPLIVIGILAGAAGLTIDLYAAWVINVVDVNAILRAVS